MVTVSVYIRVPPAVTGSGESPFVIARSAEALIVVPCDALLLPGTGSLSLADTVAELLIEPPSDGAVTEMVITGAVPGARLERVHDTLPTPGVQVHPVPVAFTYPTPDGSVSVTVTLCAVLGPLLVTVMVYDNAPPAVTGSAESVLVMERFDTPVTTVGSVELLSAGTGSPSLADTIAVLLMAPLSGGAVSVTVMTGAVAMPRPALVHVSVPLTGAGHVHPVPLALTNDAVAGRVSVTVTPVAEFGPLLATVIKYENVPPAVTGSEESVWVMERLTAGVTFVLAVELLLDKFESFTLEETLAVLLMEPPADGPVTVMVISGAAPTARLDLVHVTSPPLWLHVHPVPLALT